MGSCWYIINWQPVVIIYSQSLSETEEVSHDTRHFKNINKHHGFLKVLLKTPVKLSVVTPTHSPVFAQPPSYRQHALQTQPRSPAMLTLAWGSGGSLLLLHCSQSQLLPCFKSHFIISWLLFNLSDGNPLLYNEKFWGKHPPRWFCIFQAHGFSCPWVGCVRTPVVYLLPVFR